MTGAVHRGAAEAIQSQRCDSFRACGCSHEAGSLIYQPSAVAVMSSITLLSGNRRLQTWISAPMIMCVHAQLAGPWVLSERRRCCMELCVCLAVTGAPGMKECVTSSCLFSGQLHPGPAEEKLALPQHLGDNSVGTSHPCDINPALGFAQLID